MKQLLLLVWSLFSLTSGFAQKDTVSAKDLELTEKNIKRLFSMVPDMCCPAPPPEWTACYDTDSIYATADTIRLYSDMYYYMAAHCCYVTSWTFANSTTFSVSETNVCQEPPLSSVNPENCGLKLKFGRQDATLTMAVYKNNKVKEVFHIILLDYMELKKDQYAYRLTLVRQKTGRV